LVPDTAPSDYPSAPGPDPDSFLFVRIAGQTGGDIYLGSISGAYPPKALIQTPTYEGGAALTLDHRWMVYQSAESGQPEIYLRPYPALAPVLQVSAGGGVQTRFARNGREIYYRAGGRMMAVSADLTGKTPILGRPVALFEDVYNFGNGISVPNYDVTLDGQFIMTRSEPESGRLHVVLNWTEEWKRLISTGGQR
jgi:serine/threonine-protein kinase